MIEIEIADQQTTLELEPDRLEQAARAVLADHGPDQVQVSIAIVDDSTIHQLNRQYLQHDYATDVLSFVLESGADGLEGEVIVSADTAVTQASQYGLSAEDELLLYVIHGTLHLVGFDDTSEELREPMRCAERYYLKQSGVVIEARNGAEDRMEDQS